MVRLPEEQVKASIDALGIDDALARFARRMRERGFVTDSDPPSVW